MGKMMGIVKGNELQDGNVEELRSVSVAINDYFTNKHYLAMEEFDEDEISDVWLSRKAHAMALEELEEMGLTTTTSKEEMVLDGYRMNLICKYRIRFDGGSLVTLFSEADDRTLAALESRLDIPEGGEGEIHHGILEELMNRYPTNDTWSELAKETDLFQSSTRFADHISAILQSASNIESFAVIDELRLKQVSIYIDSVAKRRHDFHTATTSLMRNAGQLDKLKLMNAVKSHDLDLATSSGIAILSSSYDNVDDALTSESEFMQKHKRSKQHHIEYYEFNNSIPNKDQIALIVAEQYKPTLGRDVYVKNILSSLQQFGSRVTAIATELAQYMEFYEPESAVVKTPALS